MTRRRAIVVFALTAVGAQQTAHAYVTRNVIGSFIGPLNRWVDEFNGHPRGIVTVKEEESWKETKAAWRRFRDAINRFYA